jgi:hypothetical protein
MEAPAASAQCPRHPGRSATGACARCGAFHCDLDGREVDGALYCETCAQLSEVDYLEAFRKKYWGRRDGWAWLVGMGSVLNAASALASAFAGAGPRAVLLGLLGAVVGICFWLGLRFARIGLLAMNGVAAGLLFAEGGALGLAAALLPATLALSIYADTRNQLFFKIDVPRKKLQKAWDLYQNNSYARTGFLLSFIGLVAFPIAAVSLFLCVLGLRQVDRNAHPPIGRRGQAIAGLVMSSLGLAFGLGVLAWALFVER